jgi:hypothetical protein
MDEARNDLENSESTNAEQDEHNCVVISWDYYEHWRSTGERCVSVKRCQASFTLALKSSIGYRIESLKS